MTPVDVEFFFEPLCPWTWITSRWILEAETVRPIRVSWAVMSLAVLNDGPDTTEAQRQQLAPLWGPVRLLTAARLRYGREVLLPLYTQIGLRVFNAEREDIEAVVEEAVNALDLAPDLLTAMTDDRYDDQVRAEHDRGIEMAGGGVGSPIIHLPGPAGEHTAFFGPVISPAPDGEAAGDLWDCVQALARTRGFFELKRGRTVGPVFT